MRKLNLPFVSITVLALFAFLLPVNISPANASLVGNGNQATLSISPEAGSFNANDNFVANIYLNTHSQNVVVAAVYLNYDRTHFQAVSIDMTGSVFSFEAEKMIDPANGKIKITRGIPTPGVNLSNGLVAKINFKALSNVSPVDDNFTFDFIAGSTVESNVILDDGKGTEILSGVYNAKYTIGSGGPVTYGDGRLLRASDSEKIYLIENSQKRWIPTGEIFTANGYLWSNVILVDPSALVQYPDGPNVSAANMPAIPEGGLIRATGEIDVYIVKYAGSKKFKRLILSPSVFNNYGHLKWSDIKDVDLSVADSFTASDLVRAEGDAKVYKLYPSGDTGEKRWIKTAEAFANLGFDWDAVYQINQFDRDSYIEKAVLE